MESEPVRRKSCLLRLRENCPFRKLRRQTYDLSAAASSPAGRFWNDVRPPTTDQPISIVCSQSVPPPSGCACSPGQSEADVHMEEDPPAAESQQLDQQNPESRAEERMELDDDIDPETGEKAMG